MLRRLPVVVLLPLFVGLTFTARAQQTDSTQKPQPDTIRPQQPDTSRPQQPDTIRPQQADTSKPTLNDAALDAIITAKTPVEYTIAGVIVTGATYDQSVLVSIAGINVGDKVILPGGKILVKPF